MLQLSLPVDVLHVLFKDMLNKYSLDYRTVPLGEIDLQHEIRFSHDTGIVDRELGRPRVRRMYTAKVAGQITTVAMYQGCGAEEVRYILLSADPHCVQTPP